MPNSTTSPNMGLTIPTVSVDPQVQWGTDLNSSLTVIDTHDHSSGKGVKITPNGITISIDLSFVSNNATNLRSARFTQQSTSLTGPNDLGCVYDVLGDLWWNNASGTAVQITKGSVLNAAALLSNTWNTVSFSGTRTMHATDGYTLLIFNAGSVACTANLPAASTLQKGTYFVFVDGYNNVENNSFTLSPNGADLINGTNANYTFEQNGGHLIVSTDGVNHWYVQPSGGYYLRGNSIILSKSNAFIQLGTAAATIATNAGNNTIVMPNITLQASGDTTASSNAKINIPSALAILSYRNAANNADITALTTDASDNLTIGSGANTIVSANSQVSMQNAYNFANWSGSTNTQHKSNVQYAYTISTTNSAATAVVSATIPNNSAACVTHHWIARNTSTGASWTGASVALYQQSGGGLTVVGSEALITTIGSSPPSLAFATSGANTATIQIVGLVATNIDWQGIVIVSIN